MAERAPAAAVTRGGRTATMLSVEVGSERGGVHDVRCTAWMLRNVCKRVSRQHSSCCVCTSVGRVPCSVRRAWVGASAATSTGAVGGAFPLPAAISFVR